MKLKDILTEISRRDFLKGATAAGALAASGSLLKDPQAKVVPPVPATMPRAVYPEGHKEEWVSDCMSAKAAQREEYMQQWDKIRKGMSFEEVQEILGPPQSRVNSEDSDGWSEYRYNRGVARVIFDETGTVRGFENPGPRWQMAMTRIERKRCEQAYDEQHLSTDSDA